MESGHEGDHTADRGGPAERQARHVAEAQAVAIAANARLARLQRITAALNTTASQGEIAAAVLQEAILALECDAGVVVVTDATGSVLELLGALGPYDPLMRSFTLWPDFPGPYSDVMDRQMATYLESIEEMRRRHPEMEALVSDELRGAWIFLPLEIDGRAVGALAFGYAAARRFGLQDRHFADTVARYCAQALDRVRLRVAAAAALAEAQAARQMAEQANSAKTLFLGAMSHELRTPLNAIAGYTELLELGIRGEVNAAQLEDLRRIKRASAYLLRLINDVLSVARLEGARPLRLATIVVDDALEEVHGMCALQAAAQKLAFTITRSDCHATVLADPERFQQILLNLITNAIKFTPSGGRIAMACNTVGDTVHISVTDSGVGVKPADLERVFEPFVQVDRHLTLASQQGVGLGLSISRELARAMQGDLSATSVEGEGSTFTLTLPLVAPGGRPATGAGAS